MKLNIFMILLIYSDISNISLCAVDSCSSWQRVDKKKSSDKKAILYSATLLDSDNAKILELCLDIFENFLENDECHLALISTFGVYESLESVSIRMRNTNEELYKRTTEITEKLRSSAPPAYSTRSRGKGGNIFKKQTVYLMFIPNLTKENRQKLEATLVKIKGVISFLIDLAVKRCTLRICPKVNIKEVVEKVFGKCGLKCLIVTKTREEKEESYYDVLMNTPNRSYLEFSDEDFLQKSGAITAAHAEQKCGSGFLGSVRKFWTESFYW